MQDGEGVVLYKLLWDRNLTKVILGFVQLVVSYELYHGIHHFSAFWTICLGHVPSSLLCKSKDTRFMFNILPIFKGIISRSESNLFQLHKMWWISGVLFCYFIDTIGIQSPNVRWWLGCIITPRNARYLDSITILSRYLDPEGYRRFIPVFRRDFCFLVLPSLKLTICEKFHGWRWALSSLLKMGGFFCLTHTIHLWYIYLHEFWMVDVYGCSRT